MSKGIVAAVGLVVAALLVGSLLLHSAGDKPSATGISMQALEPVDEHLAAKAQASCWFKVRNRSSRVPGASPSSRFTELRIARPPIHCSAVSTTWGSVESIISGTVAWVAKRLPVHGRIFLVHGEPPAMAVFAQHLAGIGCDPSRIVMPALDEGFQLQAAAAEATVSTPRLAPAEALAHEDWHNLHSRLLLDLAERLGRAPDDAARRLLLERVRAAMAS